MRVLACLLFAASELVSWESHGEVMDDETLDQLVLEDEMIDAINNDPTSTWTAGRNEIFEGATLRQAKQRLGLLQDTDSANYLPYRPLENYVELPTEFDWRTDPRAAKCPSLKEVRDQSNCGSCWAFGSVEAMTDRRCIASKGEDQVHLSAQDVTSCDHMGDMGCNGGVPSTVYSYYANFGIVDGGNYGDKSMCYSYELAPCSHHTNSSKYQPCPASTSTPSCARKCVDDGKSWFGGKHKGAAGYSVCAQGTADSAACAEAMAQDIYQNGPITGMFFVHKSFTSYKSGVYSSGFFITDPMLGGHAIKIMGFGTENGTPYWLVANSWNEDWGMGGYFKIKRGANMDMIESAVINGGPVAGKPKTEQENILV